MLIELYIRDKGSIKKIGDIYCNALEDGTLNTSVIFRGVKKKDMSMKGGRIEFEVSTER